MVFNVAREVQIPEPAAVSFKLPTNGPIAPAAAWRILAPVPVMPLEITTEVSDLSNGRYIDTPVAVAVLAVLGTTCEPVITLV